MLAAAIAVTIAIVVLGGAYAWQRKLIYLPSGGPVPAAAEVLPGGRDVTLHTTDGLELGAWFLPGRGPRADGRAVLVANGNAGNRQARAPLARALSARGLAVLLFDYRGYGGNPGSPSESGLAADVRAARDYLVGTVGVPTERLVYFGESLGAGVVAELATEHPPAALVLRSPFTDLAAVGQRHYPFLPVRLLLKDTYPVLRHVSRSQAPLTVVYGSADSIVPPGQSRAVARAGEGRLVEVPGAGHNDPVLLDGPLLVDAIVRASTD